MAVLFPWCFGGSRFGMLFCDPPSSALFMPTATSSCMVVLELAHALLIPHPPAAAFCAANNTSIFERREAPAQIQKSEVNRTKTSLYHRWNEAKHPRTHRSTVGGLTYRLQTPHDPSSTYIPYTNYAQPCTPSTDILGLVNIRFFAGLKGQPS